MKKRPRTRILLVDDQKHAVEFHRRAIEDKHTRVVLCTDSDSAWDLFDEMEARYIATYDLIILDMLMTCPIMGRSDCFVEEYAVGAHLLSRLRSWNDSVPVVIFTQLPFAGVLDRVWDVFRARQQELGRDVPDTNEADAKTVYLRDEFKLEILQKSKCYPERFATHIREILRRT